MSFKLKTWPAAALLATALLAACGGSGDQIEPFQPTRVLAFGDEASLLTAQGRKYTVNSLDTNNVLDCTLNPIWTQTLAASYGLVFPQCNPTNVATTSRILAQDNATVAAVTAQVDAFVAGGDSFAAKDLVTVLAGTHDVLAQYDRWVAGTSEAEVLAAAEAAGTALAQQVNRIANAGGKVLISTIPNVGVTPYAVAQETARAGSADLLSRLTARFNSRLRVNLENDGRKIGLILADENIDAIVRFGAGFANVNAPACNTATVGDVTQCTTATLVATGAENTYLWADTLQLSIAGHRVLGGLAVTRARGNPF